MGWILLFQMCDVVKPNPPFAHYRAHVYGEYLASEHECELVQCACVHEYVAHKTLQNVHADDAYRYDNVNVYGSSLYGGEDVNVFQCL